MGINTQVSVPLATTSVSSIATTTAYQHGVTNNAPHVVKNVIASKEEASYLLEFPPVDPSGVYWGVISKKPSPLVNNNNNSKLVFVGQKCIVGHFSQLTPATYKYSTDGGNTFTDVLGVGLTTTPSQYLIESDGTKFYAVSNTEIFSSVDGITWTKLNSGAITLGVVAGLAVNGTRIVVINTSGGVSVSTNSGATFTAATPISSMISGCTRLVFYAGLFVAIAAYSSTMWFIYTSPDGVTWTLRKPFSTSNSPTSNNYFFTVQNNLLFLIPATTGDASLWKTADGVTWVEHPYASFSTMSEDFTLGLSVNTPSSRGIYGLYYYSGKYLIITTVGAYVTDLSTYFERIATKTSIPMGLFVGFTVTPSGTVLLWPASGGHAMEYDLNNKRQRRLHVTNLRTMVSDIEVEYV